MALNIKDPETEALATEVAALTGTSKTAAVRDALRERKASLARRDDVTGRRKRLHQFLEEEIWPHVPAEIRGRSLSKAEREEILGYGPDGV